MRICSVEGCKANSHARSWCVKHYMRWRRNGDPREVKPYNRLPDGIAARNERIYAYKARAHRENYVWNLSDAETIILFEGNCFYCGTKPNKLYGRPEKTTGLYLANGIDRMDNSKGYLSENVVSCCWICNKFKRAMSDKEFLGLVDKIYVNQILIGRREKKNE